MIAREPENAAERQWADLHASRPDSFAPLGSMVLVYCTACASQRLCDERGCIKLVRAAKRTAE